jgi:hypothetical protein
LITQYFEFQRQIFFSRVLPENFNRCVLFVFFASRFFITSSISSLSKDAKRFWPAVAIFVYLSLASEQPINKTEVTFDWLFVKRHENIGIF